MGHIRLGRLPKSRVWDEVIELVGHSPDDIPGIAAAVLDASATALERTNTIAAASRAFLILLQLAQAAEGGDIACTPRWTTVHSSTVRRGAARQPSNAP